MSNATPETMPRTEKPAPRTARAERAEKIKSIFRSQIKTLEGLFPKDGRTMVVRAVATAVSVSNRLEDRVTAESIAEQAIACHHLGLEVGDQAYIYPFKTEAKLIVGPRGLIALAYRGGFLRSLVARSVFDGDEFTYNLGDNSLLHRKLVGNAEHSRRPTWTDERGEVRPVEPQQLITHAYAVLDTTTDGRTIEVLTWEDLAYYRGFSAAKSGPWFDNFEGMARKTAVKRILEFVPRSPLLSAALAETSEGAYELPDEIASIVDKAIRARDAKAAPVAPVREVVLDEAGTGEQAGSAAA